MTGSRCAARSSKRHVPTKQDVDDVVAGWIVGIVSGVAVGADLAVGLTMLVGVQVGGKVGRAGGVTIGVRVEAIKEICVNCVSTGLSIRSSRLLMTNIKPAKTANPPTMVTCLPDIPAILLRLVSLGILFPQKL